MNPVHVQLEIHDVVKQQQQLYMQQTRDCFFNLNKTDKDKEYIVSLFCWNAF